VSALYHAWDMGILFRILAQLFGLKGYTTKIRQHMLEQLPEDQLLKMPETASHYIIRLKSSQP